MLLKEAEPMAKRRRRGRPPKDDGFERIELQVPEGWTDAIDRVARALGLSRSSYIRQAVSERLLADRKRLGFTEEEK
jgi:hypothetical protein